MTHAPMPCCHDECGPAANDAAQRRTLWIVLALNAAMFVGEFALGWIAHSTALLADSLDMLGDALVYTVSLFVVARGTRAKAWSAGFKGAVMLVFGLIVSVEVVYKLLHGLPPQSALMAATATVALAGNVCCLLLLTRHRGEDVNMRSVWICSRNDLFANSGVIVAAGLVAWTGTFWPDVIVGAAIAALFMRSAVSVLVDAWRSHDEAQQTAVPVNRS